MNQTNSLISSVAITCTRIFCQVTLLNELVFRSARGGTETDVAHSAPWQVKMSPAEQLISVPGFRQHCRDNRGRNQKS